MNCDFSTCWQSYKLWFLSLLIRHYNILTLIFFVPQQLWFLCWLTELWTIVSMMSTSNVNIKYFSVDFGLWLLMLYNLDSDSRFMKICWCKSLFFGSSIRFSNLWELAYYTTHFLHNTRSFWHIFRGSYILHFNTQCLHMLQVSYYVKDVLGIGVMSLTLRKRKKKQKNPCNLWV